MILLTGFLMVLGALLVLLLPFLWARKYASPHLDLASRAAMRRREIYKEIEGLFLEHGLGSFDEAEYQSRFRMLRLEAADVLRSQHTLSQDLSVVDRDLEIEISSFRQTAEGPSSQKNLADGRNDGHQG